MTHEQLSTLIGQIYDCALSPERWNETIEHIARAIGSQMGLVVLHDHHENKSIRTFSFGISAHTIWDYELHYAQRNPIATICMAGRPEGDVHTARTLFDNPDQWFRSAMYRELIRSTGARDVIGLYALHSEERGVWLGAFRRRRDPNFGLREQRILRLLAPHIIRIMRFTELLEMRAISAERLVAALDTLSSGVWLVDRNYRVLHANAAGEALLRRQGAPLRIFEGRLTASMPADAQRLSRAIHRAVAGELVDEASNGTATHEAIPLGDAALGEALVATVVPLCNSAPPASAVVFVQGPAAAPVTRLDAFGALHGLTPAELRCLNEIFLGRNVPEVANALGVAPTTIRSQLSRIFEKTLTTSQTELTRLVASFVAPIRAS
jgi:DNA-binding CsgD family transcriptional regulator/PAS domain-containing protein